MTKRRAEAKPEKRKATQKRLPRVISLPQAQRRLSRRSYMLSKRAVITTYGDGTYGPGSGSYESVSGSSAPRLRSQLEWLISQEVDYLLSLGERKESERHPIRTLRVIQEPATIIDFLAYKEERYARENS